jgi:hypothetical protein
MLLIQRWTGRSQVADSRSLAREHQVEDGTPHGDGVHAGAIVLGVQFGRHARASSPRSTAPALPATLGT